MESRNEVSGSYSEIETENGLKIGPSFKSNILMKNIRKFSRKLIKASHVKIGQHN